MATKVVDASAVAAVVLAEPDWRAVSYDAAYLLARSMQAELVTLDKKLARTAAAG
jgi:predicted nucleic acid-binding protein